MKSIMVPIERHDVARSTLETAFLLARSFDSYVEGFAVRWTPDTFVFGDSAMAIPMDSHKQEELQLEAKRIRETFEYFMREHKVPRAMNGMTCLSFGWLNDPLNPESFIGDHGRVFDVIVMNRPDAKSSGLYHRALESGLFESGHPVLLAPPRPPVRVGTNILIPWNGSTEQARAIALAMPLLQRAERVTVLTVTGGTGVPGPSPEQVIGQLRRNSIRTQPLVVGLDGRSTGEAILTAAQSINCDLLIKGAFTQSRLRQMIFGGATQYVMAHAELPVLFAH